MLVLACSFVLNTARAHHTGPPPDCSFVRSFSTRRARTTTGPPPDRKDTPSKGGAVVWEPSSTLKGRSSGLGAEPEGSQHPRPHTRQHRGLGFRSSRSPYLGALKYHVVAPASAVAHPLFVRSFVLNTARAHHNRPGLPAARCSSLEQAESLCCSKQEARGGAWVDDVDSIECHHHDCLQDDF